MIATELLKTETDHYRLLSEQLKCDYGALDDETLADTLEGLSDLPDLIAEIVRSSIEDQTWVAALKLRLEEMTERLTRLKERCGKKRDLVCWAMGAAGLANLQLEDFSVSLRSGLPRLEVLDESKVPELYLVPQPAKLDRTRLLGALKQGEQIEGASLVMGGPHITVRTK